MRYILNYFLVDAIEGEHIAEVPVVKTETGVAPADGLYDLLEEIGEAATDHFEMSLNSIGEIPEHNAVDCFETNDTDGGRRKIWFWFRHEIEGGLT